MNIIKVKLESLDGQVITPRTGKTSVLAELIYLPHEGQTITCMYLDEDCESPGVRMETNGIEQYGSEIKFYDYDRRPFKLTLI